MNSKRLAGEKAVEFIEDGMIVGLGTGSTVYYTILKLSEKVKNGLKIKAVSTSNSTTQIAEGLGITIVPFNEVNCVDLTIDGADEVDCSMNGIKGGGGALLYEKIVALSSKKVIWVVDESKIVNTLGKYPLPIEVIPFAHHHIFKKLENLNMNPVLRKINNEIYITDGNHYIIDLFLKNIEKPYVLENQLRLISGIVDTGLFLDVADFIIIGGKDGVRVINRK